MIKEEINLLPPPQQRLRQQRIYLNRAGRLLYVVGAAAVIMLIIIGVNDAVTRYINTTVAMSQDKQSAKDNEALQQAQHINQLLAAANRWATAHQPWTPQVQDALSVLPAGITITKISADEQKEAITIEGEFASRTAVTNYRQALEALPWLKKLTAPLSNYATGSDVKFIFELERRLPADATPSPSATNL